MPPRKIENLAWARTLKSRPKFIPKPKTRGIVGKGLTYEKKFGKILPASSIHGQWFEFQDANGHGYCETDHLLPLGRQHIGIFECKLSRVGDARTQLSWLYAPVVEKALGRIPLMFVVTKSLSRETRLGNVCNSMEDAILLAIAGEIPTIHWIGVGKM